MGLIICLNINTNYRSAFYDYKWLPLTEGENLKKVQFEYFFRREQSQKKGPMERRNFFQNAIDFSLEESVQML